MSEHANNHDDHGHHHKETFVTKYIFSQDHKMISKQYLSQDCLWESLVSQCHYFSDYNLLGQIIHLLFMKFFLENGEKMELWILMYTYL